MIVVVVKLVMDVMVLVGKVEGLILGCLGNLVTDVKMDKQKLVNLLPKMLYNSMLERLLSSKLF